MFTIWFVDKILQGIDEQSRPFGRKKPNLIFRIYAFFHPELYSVGFPKYEPRMPKILTGWTPRRR